MQSISNGLTGVQHVSGTGFRGPARNIDSRQILPIGINSC
jgi:hypothetical protein